MATAELRAERLFAFDPTVHDLHGLISRMLLESDEGPAEAAPAVALQHLHRLPEFDARTKGGPSHWRHCQPSSQREHPTEHTWRAAQWHRWAWLGRPTLVNKRWRNRSGQSGHSGELPVRASNHSTRVAHVPPQPSPTQHVPTPPRCSARVSLQGGGLAYIATLISPLRAHLYYRSVLIRSELAVAERAAWIGQDAFRRAFGRFVDEVVRPELGGGEPSRRRDCHSADTPSPCMLKHLLQGEGGAAE